MGYRSNGVLGLKKEVYVKYALLMDDGIPKLLEDMEKEGMSGRVYYYFEDWKMYSSYPDVKEFYDWLDLLDEEEDVEVYGYMEIGEEGEVTERGEPYEFDISSRHYIDSPVTGD